MRRLLYVAYFLEVGLLLLLVPWSGFWDQNYFVAKLPALQALVGNHFTRGGVSGLGLVNLYAGVTELASVLSRRRGPAASSAVAGADGGSSD